MHYYIGYLLLRTVLITEVTSDFYLGKVFVNEISRRARAASSYEQVARFEPRFLFYTNLILFCVSILSVHIYLITNTILR